MKQLRAYIKKILSESIVGDHFEERLFGRFLNRTHLPVGYEIAGSVGKYVIVGTYVIPEKTKSQIEDNVNLLKQYNFPKNKSYAVKIIELRINPEDVRFHSEHIVNNKTLVIVDEVTKSNGNVIYAIVRTNTLVTSYFAKSYVKQTAEKIEVDVITSMDAVRNKKIY